MQKTEINLRDYLSPGGRYPYAQLTVDMERQLAAGVRVLVISVSGTIMAFGHPGDSRPWSDGERSYKTAKDCIDRKRGRK